MMSLIRDWVLDPLGLLLLWTGALVLLAMVLERRSRGSWIRRSLFILLGLAGFVVVAGPAVVNPLLAQLERREPTVTCPAGTPIVALGGGARSSATDVTDFSAMSTATLARTHGAIELALSDTTAPVVTVGGGLGTLNEADLMAELIERSGIAPGRLLRERTSTDTADNARQVRALLPESDTRAIRLVTSAAHMPRAAGVFRARGFEVCAYPVDRLALDDVPFWALWPQSTAMLKFDRWLHESVALLLYRQRGDL